MIWLFRYIIKVYSIIISPILGRNCRYYPTCSHYADQALARHGIFKGLFLSITRILRCHPWSKHSFIDPVPKQFTWSEILGYKRTIKEKQHVHKNIIKKVNYDES